MRQDYNIPDTGDPWFVQLNFCPWFTANSSYSPWFKRKLLGGDRNYSFRKCRMILYEAARTKATVVVLMGLGNLKEIVKLFQNEGKNKLPVAVIQSGSTENEKIAA